MNTYGVQMVTMQQIEEYSQGRMQHMHSVAGAFAPSKIWQWVQYTAKSKTNRSFAFLSNKMSTF